MRGLEWGRLYEKYHTKKYDKKELNSKVIALYSDGYVKDRTGIWEYVLGGCLDTTLLEVRFFDNATKKSTYISQTSAAQDKGISNCPLCADGRGSQKNRIWDLRDMDADHISAWSKGGKTASENCQMLCKTHNRVKGNR